MTRNSSACSSDLHGNGNRCRSRLGTYLRCWCCTCSSWRPPRSAAQQLRWDGIWGSNEPVSMCTASKCVSMWAYMLEAHHMLMKRSSWCPAQDAHREREREPGTPVSSVISLISATYAFTPSVVASSCGIRANRLRGNTVLVGSSIGSGRRFPGKVTSTWWKEERTLPHMTFLR